MNLRKRIERLEANQPEMTDNFSSLHIYNPENQEVIHTTKTPMPNNTPGVALYLPDNGRESITKQPTSK